MNRRVFLTTFIVGAAGFSTQSLLEFEQKNDSKVSHLKAGDVVIAKSGASLRLPKDPRDGDTVQIIVENNTLSRPCLIQYETTSIAGDHEPLILDSIANFRLVYRSESKNWVIA